MTTKALVAALALSIAGACSHGSGTAAKPQPAKPVTPPAAQTAQDVLGFIPADAQIVVGLDVAGLRASPLYKDFADQIDEVMHAVSEHTKMSCVDIKTADKITVGITIDPKPHIVFVLHAPNAAAHLECVRTGLAANNMTATLEGGVMIASTDKGALVETAVGDATTVLEAGPGVSKDTLGVTLAGGVPLRASAAFTDVFGKLDSHATMWGIANGNAGFWKALNIDVKSVDATIQVTDKLAIAARVEMKTPDAANQLATQLSGQAGQVKMFFDKLDIKAEGTTMKIDAAMTSSQLHQLVTLVGMARSGGGGD